MSPDKTGSVERHLDKTISVARYVIELLSQSQEQVKKHPKVKDALKQFQTMVLRHREALENRLRQLGMPADMQSQKEEADISEILCQLYGAFSQAALGYSILHALAHRSFDREGEGNTRDLVKKHLSDYAKAVNEIHEMVFDAVVRELDSTGEECQCQCTTCALGICTCVPMGVGRAHKEWLDIVSAGALGSILLTAPRRGSAAARAGLRSGDTILAADGEEIHANAELHAVIKKHQKGELATLTVRRISGEVENIVLIC